MKKKTWPGRLQRRLLPGAAEQEEGFREEILRIGHSGLRAVGGVEVGLSVFLMAGRLAAAPPETRLWLELLEAAIPLALGVATITLSGVQATYAWSRAMAWVSCFLAACATNWCSLLWRNRAGAFDFTLEPITVLLLVAVAAVPLQPLHTLALGCSMGASYGLLANWLAPRAGPQATTLIFVLLLTLLATGITAFVYGERRAAYKSWVRTVRAFEDLRQAQSRVLLSEHAAFLGRLAAALTHELNSPIGALMSAVETLVRLAAKQAVSPPAEQEQLVRLQTDLHRSMQESARRLQQVVGRIQRFTNLDQAEIREVDVNGLLRDVHVLVEPQAGSDVALRLNLNPVPPLTCRPQQLSAVFLSLLNNAIRAVGSDGAIVVSTRQRDQQIEVEIRDAGRGMATQELRTIFDPGFRVSDDRVVRGHWSMYAVRQIVRAHGGEIHITSKRNRGTTVIVTLPLNQGAVRV